jgi:hypothetical protein
MNPILKFENFNFLKLKLKLFFVYSSILFNLET